MTEEEGNIYIEISIHTPHTRCDLTEEEGNINIEISIQTPHTWCDLIREAFFIISNGYFNPHTSYEV